MKKVIAFLTIAIITTITGCSKVEVSTNIEDFYLQSIIEQTEDISLEDAKKALANFEYEYELQEYSKELSEEEKNLFERDMQADRTIEISVKDGTGLDELREVLLSFLRNRKKYVERLYGYDEMGKIQLLRKYGQIVTEEYRDDGVAVTGYVPNEYYNQIQ